MTSRITSAGRPLARAASAASPPDRRDVERSSSSSLARNTRRARESSSLSMTNTSAAALTVRSALIEPPFDSIVRGGGAPVNGNRTEFTPPRWVDLRLATRTGPPRLEDGKNPQTRRISCTATRACSARSRSPPLTAVDRRRSGLPHRASHRRASRHALARPVGRGGEERRDLTDPAAAGHRLPGRFDREHGPGIANVRTNATSIMNNIRAQQADSQFAAAEYRDFNRVDHSRIGSTRA